MQRAPSWFLNELQQSQLLNVSLSYKKKEKKKKADPLVKNHQENHSKTSADPHVEV